MFFSMHAYNMAVHTCAETGIQVIDWWMNTSVLVTHLSHGTPYVQCDANTVILHLTCIRCLKLTGLNVQIHSVFVRFKFKVWGVMLQLPMQTTDVSSFSGDFPTELVFQQMTLNVPAKCVSMPAEMVMVSSYCWQLKRPLISESGLVFFSVGKIINLWLLWCYIM